MTLPHASKRYSPWPRISKWFTVRARLYDDYPFLKASMDPFHGARQWCPLRRPSACVPFFFFLLFFFRTKTWATRQGFPIISLFDIPLGEIYYLDTEVALIKRRPTSPRDSGSKKEAKSWSFKATLQWLGGSSIDGSNYYAFFFLLFALASSLCYRAARYVAPLY